MGRQMWLASLFTLIVVGALLGGPPGAAAQTPTPVTVLPPGSSTNGVWCSSSSDVFVVGYDGKSGALLLHFDGKAWSDMGTDSYWCNAVWGPGAGDGGAATDVFAVGPYGRILHYDGSVWSPMKNDTHQTLVAVAGSSGRDVFAVGESGTILHYDGTAWSAMDSGWPVKPLTHESREGLGSSAYLVSVWCGSPSDVFAVGDFGTILHYDPAREAAGPGGRAWSAMTSGTTEDLHGVWGTSGNDVFASGTNGTILHYDGKAWSPMVSGTHDGLSGPWGTSGSDVFLAGNEGRLLHYDGKAWSTIDTGTKYALDMISGSSDNDIFVTAFEPGCAIVHYDGKAWSTILSTAR
jgi:hypothetical protein